MCRKGTALLVCITGPGIGLTGEPKADKSERNLGDLSLEQLMNESVTSVAKKETKLSQSPAAISVITQEDIRRSGMSSIPELLRTVPGLDVARINANEWAISSRGFNGQYANKLLVLMDGRTIYTPSFAGVYWNAQDMVLEDIDRIEVIRGPGAALWGANAVNGVINITSKSAKETQGFLLSTTAGTEEQPSTSVRYGGKLGTNLYYRAYVKYANRDGLVDSTGKDAPDAWNSARSGMRMDWFPTEENHLTLQGDYYYGTVSESARLVSLTPPYSRIAYLTEWNRGANTLGRFTHDFSDTSQLTLQAYYDYFSQAVGQGRETRQTGDFDVQHRLMLGDRNDIVWGAGYRYTSGRVTPTFDLSYTPEQQADQLFNVFVQDDLTLVPERLHFIFGSKFEHNDYTGFEVQPTGRLLWTPAERHTIWGSVSRAVRTPSRFDTTSRLNIAAFGPPFAPNLISIFGNQNLKAEEVYAYELGYRVEPLRQLSLDVAAFYNVYDNLLGYSSDPSRFEAIPAPGHTLFNPMTYQNNLGGKTFGVEFSAQWKVTENWRLTGSYTWMQARIYPVSGSAFNNPQNQFQLRSSWNVFKQVGLDAALYYVSDTMPGGTTLAQQPVPAYFRADLGVSWRPTKNLEVGVWGQNLFDNQHPEYNSVKTTLRTEVPRSVVGKIILRF